MAEKPREILFRPDIANDAFDLASCDVESGDQGLSAVYLLDYDSVAMAVLMIPIGVLELLVLSF